MWLNYCDWQIAVTNVNTSTLNGFSSKYDRKIDEIAFKDH